MFIVGAPRSGTTWLHELLSYHHDIASIAPIEQTIFGNYLPEINAIWEKQKSAMEDNKWAQGLPYLWTDEEYNTFVSKFIEEVYSKISNKKPSASLIIDKQPNYSNHMFLIKKHLPNAKFIHIIRDGRDVVFSSKKAYINKGFMHKEIKVIAEKWVRFNKNIELFKLKYPDNVISIRYEEMIDPFKTPIFLEKIFEHCNIDSKSSTINKCITMHNEDVNVNGESNNKVSLEKHLKTNNWNSTLSLKDKYIFKLHAGEYLIDKGYEVSDNWVCNSLLDKIKIGFLKLGLKLKIVGE